MKRLIVAITGASGAELGVDVLRELKRLGVETHLVISEGAKAVISQETSLDVEEIKALANYCYEDNELGATISSGSFETDGMIVVPCSMKTLSGIANAFDENLTIRAADVCLKERRKLVLVPREMPFNNAHIRNMLTASQDGAVIIPPMMTFYSGAQTVDAQVRHITGKILMQFGLSAEGFRAWAGPKGE